MSKTESKSHIEELTERYSLEKIAKNPFAWAIFIIQPLLVSICIQFAYWNELGFIFEGISDFEISHQFGIFFMLNSYRVALILIIGNSLLFHFACKFFNRERLELSFYILFACCCSGFAAYRVFYQEYSHCFIIAAIPLSLSIYFMTCYKKNGPKFIYFALFCSMWWVIPLDAYATGAGLAKRIKSGEAYRALSVEAIKDEAIEAEITKYNKLIKGDNYVKYIGSRDGMEIIMSVDNKRVFYILKADLASHERKNIRAGQK